MSQRTRSVIGISRRTVGSKSRTVRRVMRNALPPMSVLVGVAVDATEGVRAAGQAVRGVAAPAAVDQVTLAVRVPRQHHRGYGRVERVAGLALVLLERRFGLLTGLDLDGTLFSSAC